MTGSFQYYWDTADVPDHMGILIHFANGDSLAYIDIRKFGSIILTKSFGTFMKQRDLGPDALSIIESNFRVLLRGRWGSIKSSLMNQSLILRIGNIYSDEIVFQAGIHPETMVEGLDETTIHKLFPTIREVLKIAIEAGAEIEELPKTYLIPHWYRAGICPQWGASLSKP